MIKHIEDFAPSPVSSTAEDARRRHIAACTTPRGGVEAALVLMAAGIRVYVAAVESWPDGYLTPHVGSMLDGFIGLLAGERGRFDSGSLDSWARHVADVIGWDMDMHEIKWEH